MSLLISGLNLPNDKPVTLFITSNRNVYLEGVLLAGKAVSVPPHGRLIDADALITTFCEWGTRLERGRYSDDADTGEAICCPFCGASMDGGQD